MWFDKLWRSGGRPGPVMTRDEAYRALSDALGIPINAAHMSKMDVATCRRVVEWARPLTDKDQEYHARPMEAYID